MFDKRTLSCLSLYRDLTTAKSDLLNGRPPFATSAIAVIAVAVPSVIVPAWNVVLFPQGRGFWEHVSLESVESFAFDPRLFPENTATEPPENEQAI